MARDRARSDARTRLSSQAVIEPSSSRVELAPRDSRAHIQLISSANMPQSENTSCPLCALQVLDNGPGLFCDKCKTWFHPSCLFVTNDEYLSLAATNDEWLTATTADLYKRIG